MKAVRTPHRANDVLAEWVPSATRRHERQAEHFLALLGLASALIFHRRIPRSEILGPPGDGQVAGCASEVQE
jgi:hypothetical protein